MKSRLVQVNQSNLRKLSKQELERILDSKGFKGLSVEFQAMVRQELAIRR